MGSHIQQVTARDGAADDPLLAASIRLGRLVIDSGPLAQMLQEVAHIVADTLGVEFCKILELQADGARLIARAAVGWPEGLIAQSFPATTQTFAGNALLSRAPLILDDLTDSKKFLDWPLLRDHGVKSGVNLVIPGTQAYGVLAVHSSRQRRFAPQELQFLQDVCDLLGVAVQSRRTQEAILESEERFRRIFEDAPIGMTILSLDLRLMRMNRAACELLGYSEEELMGFRLEELTHPEDLPELLCLSGMLAEGEVSYFQMEKRDVRKNGDAVGVKLTVNLIRDDSGNPLHAVGMMEDLTKLREHHRDLVRARFTVAHAPAAIIWTDRAGRIREVNESVSKLLQYRRDELLELHIWDLDAQIARDEWAGIWSELKASGYIERRTSLIASDGRRIPVEISGNYLAFDGDEYSVDFARNISRQVAAEDAVRASEAWYRALLENSSDLISVLDHDATVSFVSPSMERILGHKPADRIGRSGFELIHPEDIASVQEALEQGRRKHGAIGTAEFRMRHRNGTWRHVEASASNLLDDPIVSGIVVNSRDITERRRAEEWFRSSFENSSIAIGICSTDGRWLQVNPALRRLFGYSARELRKLNWQDLTFAEDLAASEKGTKKVLSGKASAFQIEKRYVHRDGHTIWCYTSSSVVRDPDGKAEGLVKMIVDISARKNAEESLRTSEARFRVAAEVASDFIFELNLEDGRLEWFGNVDKKMGYRPGGFPRTVEDWERQLHPDDREGVMQAIEPALAGGSEPPDCSYRMRRRDGSYRYWVCRAQRVRDESGKATKWVGVCTDVTEQTEAEQSLRQNEAKLRKLAAKLLRNEEEQRRVLARELHDDFGQRLTALGFDLSALGASLPPAGSEQLRHYVQKAQAHLTSLTEDMRRLAHHLHPAGLELLGLPTALRALCRESSRHDSINVSFQCRQVPESIPTDVCVCLYRIAQEGLRNAIRHSKSTKVSVMLSSRKEKDVIRLSIRDSGVGFSQLQPSKRGLGLVSMEERARLVGGEFSIESTPGKGTHLCIEVPLGNPKAELG